MERLKRLRVYFNEMFPLLPRLCLGYIVFLEIYFIVLLNHGVTGGQLLLFDRVEGQSDFISYFIQHDVTGVIIGGFTIFSFLLWLRIADDFKDYELDCRLFASRPLPSGRVHKDDLRIFATILIGVTILLNLIFMRNFIFCLILYTYGSLMAVWFFQKHKIAKSLPLALVTHNPVQIILNIYVISYAIMKYKLPIFDITNLMAVMTLSRKIRAPKEETEYVTYSKLFGYKKCIDFVFVLTWLDIFTNIVLVWNLNKISVAALLANTVWCSMKFFEYKKDPTKYRIVSKVERYTYIQESMMIATIIIYLIVGKI